MPDKQKLDNLVTIGKRIERLRMENAALEAALSIAANCEIAEKFIDERCEHSTPLLKWCDTAPVFEAIARTIAAKIRRNNDELETLCQTISFRGAS